MDQVKNILAVIKKHHFWILCGLAVLIGLGMAVVAKNKLIKGPDGYEAEKSKITSAQGSVAPLASGPDHPNPDWVKYAEGETTKARQKVFDTWSALYKEQAAKVFQWPKDLFPDDPAFLKEFAAADDQTEKNLDRKTLKELGDRYISYITKVTLPRLAGIIDAEWTVIDEKDAARNAAAPPDTTSHKVIWDPADQQLKVDNYTWEERPSRLDMQYAQEEMWVMEALFSAIQRANSNARGSYEAPVRKLDEVLVGYDATGRFPLGEGEGRIVATMRAPPPGSQGGGESSTPARSPVEARRPNRRDQTAGAGTSYSPRSAPRSRDSSAPLIGRGADSSAPIGAEGAGGDAYAWLKDGRYVDGKCQPVLGSELQSSKTPEYKLMAFRLRLTVDESQYPRIIEELASSVLPIEVREVRILPGGEAAQNTPAPRQGGPRGGAGRAVPVPGGRGGRFSKRDSSAPTGAANRPFVPSRRPAAAAEEAGPAQHNVPMDIYGVVYLIDRPDRKKVGLTESEAGTSTAGPPSTATPAGTPTATGTTNSTDAATATAPAAATGTATTTTATAPATTPAAATAGPPGATGVTAPAPTDASKGNASGATATAPMNTPADVAPK